jgi:hypothetical protein
MKNAEKTIDFNMSGCQSTQPGQREITTCVDSAPTFAGPPSAAPINGTRHSEHTSQSTRAGAQYGNTSAQRHGLRSSRLPKGCGSIANSTGELRANLEAELLKRGPITTYQAALVQSCVRHETRAQLLARWLRLAEEPETHAESQTPKTSDGSETSTLTKRQGLGVLDKAALLRDISAATDSRDKCIEKLKLDGGDPAADLKAILYGPRDGSQA